jgi:hypothetical protein
MLKLLLETLFGPPTGASWIDLDERMRAKLKVLGALSVVVLVAVVILSSYFYLQLPQVKAVIDKILGQIGKAIEKGEEIPKWIITVGTVYFALLFGVSLVFFWILIDLAKMHYKIDRLTFNLIGYVQGRIFDVSRAVMGCPDSPECKIGQLGRDKLGRRQFMTTVFYHFANADMVGAHNQKDKRRQVFSVWTQYYAFNYLLIVVLLIALWLVFLVLINGGLIRWKWWNIGWVVPIGLVVFGWVRKGRAFRAATLELAQDQVEAFHRFDASGFVSQVRSVVKSCAEKRCPL